MTVEEFSTGFDTLVSSYRRLPDLDKAEPRDTIEFDEFEKSLFLTMSQDELVADLYSGRNPFGEAFESTEELRRYLDPLVKTAKPEDPVSGSVIKIESSSVLKKLPNDILYIVYEQVTWDDDSWECAKGTIGNVYPVTHDEYNRVRRNPFRGANKNKVLRLDCGNGIVELVSKYDFKDYMIRYVSDPEPIVLESFGSNTVSIKGGDTGSTPRSSVLPDILHNIILERAVQMALASKGVRINS